MYYMLLFCIVSKCAYFAIAEFMNNIILIETIDGHKLNPTEQQGDDFQLYRFQEFPIEF